MNKSFLLLLFISQIIFSQNSLSTKKISTSFKLHNISIEDNYSWLEDIKSVATKDWVKEQNNITTSHINEIVGNSDFEKRIRKFFYSRRNFNIIFWSNWSFSFHVFRYFLVFCCRRRSLF